MEIVLNWLFRVQKYGLINILCAALAINYYVKSKVNSIAKNDLLQMLYQRQYIKLYVFEMLRKLIKNLSYLFKINGLIPQESFQFAQNNDNILNYIVKIYRVHLTELDEAMRVLNTEDILQPSFVIGLNHIFELSPYMWKDAILYPFVKAQFERDHKIPYTTLFKIKCENKLEINRDGTILASNQGSFTSNIGSSQYTRTKYFRPNRNVQQRSFNNVNFNNYQNRNTKNLRKSEQVSRSERVSRDGRVLRGERVGRGDRVSRGGRRSSRGGRGGSETKGRDKQSGWGGNNNNRYGNNIDYSKVTVNITALKDILGSGESMNNKVFDFCNLLQLDFIPKACRFMNMVNNCKFEKCKFEHSCYVCRSSEHPAIYCDKNKPDNKDNNNN